MRTVVLETRAIAAAEAVRSGRRIEDDLVEAKVEWPDPSGWARQFAGWANRAGGEEIVLLIGLDEDAHVLASPTAEVDPESWWGTLASRFDEATPPALNAHVNVPLHGSTVIAMAFSTDRAPYVIKSLNGTAPHLEVPMRTATGTGWAHRSDLLRMLGPQVGIPAATVLDASAQADYYPERVVAEKASSARLRLSAHISFFLEHLGPQFAMLPHHAMSADLALGNLSLPLAVNNPAPRVARLVGTAPTPRPAPLPHGVDARGDGLLLTGPGRASLSMHLVLHPSSVEDIRAATSGVLTVTLPVSGSSRPVIIRADLERQADVAQPRDHEIAGAWEAALTPH